LFNSCAKGEEKKKNKKIKGTLKEINDETGISI